MFAQDWLLPFLNSLADDDPIADHEGSEDIREQLVTRIYQIPYIIKELLEPNHDWIWKGLRLTSTKKCLQTFLSFVESCLGFCNKIF